MFFFSFLFLLAFFHVFGWTMKLVVTADDFGYSKRRNRGILETFENGVVTQASLLVNGVEAQHAASLADNHGLPLGLHFNVTEGASVLMTAQRIARPDEVCTSSPTLLSPSPSPSSLTAVPSAVARTAQPSTPSFPSHAPPSSYCSVPGPLPTCLSSRVQPHHSTAALSPASSMPPSHTAADGTFVGKARAFEAAPSWQTVDVLAELQAQLRRFYTLTGRVCTHLDAHNHIFVVPQVQEAIITVAHSPISSVRVPTFHKCQSLLNPFLQRVAAETETMRTAFQQAGLKTTQAFLGLDYDRAPFSVDTVLHDVRDLIDQGVRSCELMLHPGFPTEPNTGGCGTGPDEFSQSEARRIELQVLMDPQLRRGLAELDIELVPFSDV
eukprot:m.82504 g.82504  ORF g.82504 m.82504 type:complete len:382 (+) comp14298_c0_seq1:1-1146(+)